MTQFAHLVRRRDEPFDLGFDLPARMIPRGLEPIADALVHDGDVEACAVEVGRTLAADGVALSQVLDDVELVYAAVDAGPPPYSVARTVCLAWNEVSLQFLHGLSCEDPLTGLATLPHLRSRINEVYRGAERDDLDVWATYALVVVELPATPRMTLVAQRTATGPEHFGTGFASSLRMAEVGEALRTVFSGDETLARLNQRRACGLVRRDASLGTSVESLVKLLDRWSAKPDLGDRAPRAWIESLPGTNELTTALLDELAR